MSELSPVLDHIVILISHDTLLNLSDHIQHLFTLAPGGTHADGLTSNKLVLLPDGVYIEFIAFFPDADPDKRRAHRWGNLKEGTIIDWAFTLPSDGSDDFGPIQQRVKDAHAGFFYANPVPGGRKKEDGTVIKWALSLPIDNNSGNTTIPGYLPFWCFDRTPRDLRVPYATEPRLTDHPCGVRGISSVSLSVAPSEIQGLRKVYDAVSGCSGPSTTWKYVVPSSSAAGRHTISLSGFEGEAAIKLVLNGKNRGELEVLPGIIFEVE